MLLKKFHLHEKLYTYYNPKTRFLKMSHYWNGIICTEWQQHHLPVNGLMVDVFGKVAATAACCAMASDADDGMRLFSMLLSLSWRLSRSSSLTNKYGDCKSKQFCFVLRYKQKRTWSISEDMSPQYYTQIQQPVNQQQYYTQIRQPVNQQQINYVNKLETKLSFTLWINGLWLMNKEPTCEYKNTILRLCYLHACLL